MHEVDAGGLRYMPRVPSRHTYWASAGLALIAASGFVAFRERVAIRTRRWLIPAMATIIVVHQFVYLLTVLHRRYTFRAEPTEQFLKIASETTRPIDASCFPYSAAIAQYAI